MPKVTEQYYKEKKNQILDVAFEIVREIPLYEVTMRDIIKKVGCSQGMIYRYYNNVDEIFVDLMNREIENIDFEDPLSEIFRSERSSIVMIKDAFSLLGQYIVQVQSRIGGKFYYEIQARYMFDEAKKEKILSQLVIKQNMNYFQTTITTYIMENIKNKILKPTISMDMLVLYTSVMVDGIGNQMALGQNEYNNRMFDMLGAYVIDSLGIKDSNSD